HGGRDVAERHQQSDERQSLHRDAICDWIPSIVFRWSSSVGSVLSTHAFRLGSTAPECILRNSATSSLWSFTMAFTYSRSKSAPCRFANRSGIFVCLPGLGSIWTPLL